MPPPMQIVVILTSATGSILVIDFFSQPNSGHIDVFWTTTITRISASEADLRLKKASAEFFTSFSLLRGSISMIYQFFSDYGRVPLISPVWGLFSPYSFILGTVEQDESNSVLISKECNFNSKFKNGVVTFKCSKSA